VSEDLRKQCNNELLKCLNNKKMKAIQIKDLEGGGKFAMIFITILLSFQIGKH